MDTPTYALCADIHKAYDQVWRGGLYYALQCAGVRGRAWHFITRWLDRATAVPSWNGTLGHTTPLGMGLRQGCVLSPILYCLFVNTMTAIKPAVPMPPHLNGLTRDFFSHGLTPLHPSQGVFAEHYPTPHQQVRDPVTGRAVPVFLYMDDTTLLAKSENGLKAITKRYMNFCSKFRMRLNPKKTKLLQFNKHGDWVPLKISVGEATFSTPKPNDKGTWKQKILGFHCDPAMTGCQHMQAMVDKAAAMKYKLKPIAHRLGESHALKYAATHIAPSVLYAGELVDNGRRIDALWRDTLAEATLVGKAARYENSEPYISTQGLKWHTDELPWGLQLAKRRALLHAKLVSGESTLAQKLYKTQVHKGPLGFGKQLLGDAGLSEFMPINRNQSKKWRASLNGHLRQVHLDAIHLAQQQAEEQPQSSDNLLISSLITRAGQARLWEEAVPCMATRVSAHKFKIGALSFTKKAQSQQANIQPVWKPLTKLQKANLLQCSCGKGEHTATHLWKECSIAQPILANGICLPSRLPTKINEIFNLHHPMDPHCRAGSISKLMANCGALKALWPPGFLREQIDSVAL